MRHGDSKGTTRIAEELRRLAANDKQISRRRFLNRTGAAAGGALLLGSFDNLRADNHSPAFLYPADVAYDWFDLVLKLIKSTPGFSPPVASRALGYLGVTLYETVVSGMFGYRSLAGQLPGLTSMARFFGPPIH